jgi:hypothetical protein
MRNKFNARIEEVAQINSCKEEFLEMVRLVDQERKRKGKSEKKVSIS